MVTTNRLLSGYERVSWLFDQTRCFHFVLAAEISGFATVEQWRAALDAVQNRHPLLSVGINGNNLLEPFFQQVPGMQIPLRIVDGNSLERWESELETEMALPFQSNQVPLIRAVLIQEHKRVKFILSAHHAIGDGISLSFLIRDLLYALNGKTLDPLLMPASLDSYLAVESSTNNAASNRPANVCLVLKGQQFKPRVNQLSLSPDLTSQLVARARQEGTTVHGALCAALALTKWKMTPHLKRESVKVSSPVSVRKTFNVADDCVAFFHIKTVAFEPTQDLSFWELARFGKQGLANAKTVEAVADDLTMVRQNFHNQDAVGAAQIAEVVFVYDFIVTNIGALPYETDFGPFKVESVYGPLFLQGMDGGTTLGIVTANGSLRITSVSRDSGDVPLELLKEFLVRSLQASFTIPADNIRV